jgi:hypothetical protein
MAKNNGYNGFSDAPKLKPSLARSSGSRDLLATRGKHAMDRITLM